MKVIPVPATMDDAGFESVVAELSGLEPGPVLLDAHALRWVDPYGMLGLLAVGEVLSEHGFKPRLQLPESADVMSYLARMGFFGTVGAFYELHGGAKGLQRPPADPHRDVLLEVTPVRSHMDVHAVVDRVNEKALAILTRQLHYPLKEAFQFSVVLSEVCQNIIDHAEAGGWVSTQTYNWKKRLDRKVVVIAVFDLGIGFKGSLAKEHAPEYGERWSDAAALEAAFLRGLTRFHDAGRGQGLQQIRKQVGRWNGKISIRSGTARIADVPAWDDQRPLEDGLPRFPGSQILIVLPSRVTNEEAARLEAEEAG